MFCRRGDGPTPAKANVIHHKNRYDTLPVRRAKVAALLQMVEEAEQSVLDIGPLAEQHGLSVCDAAYLELAERRAATLLTEDAILHAAGVAALGKKRCLRLAEMQERWGGDDERRGAAMMCPLSNDGRIMRIELHDACGDTVKAYLHTLRGSSLIGLC